MSKSITVLFVAFALLAGGCASNLSGESYSRDEIGSVERVQTGTVKALRPIQIEGTKSKIGAGAGAVAGGIAGSSFGGGHGSSILAVIGAVAGGLAGAAAEEGITRAQGVELTIKLDDGRTIAVAQQLSPNEKFQVGDPVRVIYGRDAVRVAHSY